MLTNINFGKYYERDSVVHKLSPVFKIISLLIMIVSIFFIDSYKDIIMLTSYLILMMIYSDIKDRKSTRLNSSHPSSSRMPSSA